MDTIFFGGGQGIELTVISWVHMLAAGHSLRSIEAGGLVVNIEGPEGLSSTRDGNQYEGSPGTTGGDKQQATATTRDCRPDFHLPLQQQFIPLFLKTSPIFLYGCSL